MSFTLVDWSMLSANTRNLEFHFTNSLERYQIPLPSEHPENYSHVLNTLIVRTEDYVFSLKGTKRRDSIDVLKKVNSDLRMFLEGKGEKDFAKGIEFWLGALLYYYFKIQKEYESSYILTMFPWSNITNCHLFMDIRAVLGLEKTYSKEQDLRMLDATTIVTSLETFRANMIANVDGIPRYQSYPHLSKNFLTRLKTIIEQHESAYAPTLKQYKAIRFIRSLMEEVNEEQSSIDKVLADWASLLKREHPNFSSLTLTGIKNHFGAYSAPKPIKDKIEEHLSSLYIENYLKGATKDHGGFLVALKSCNRELAPNIILGGYVLLLQSSSVEKKLKGLIYKMLQPESTSITSSIPVETRLLSLRFLQRWLDKYHPTTEPKLEVGFWGSLSGLREDVNLKVFELCEEIRPVASLGV